MAETTQQKQPNRVPTVVWPVAPVAIPVVLFLVAGFIGLDFGFHPDEGVSQIDPVKTAVERGILLPGRYNYPSVSFWLNIGAAVPELAAAGSAPDMKADLLARLDSAPYRLRVRAVYLILSSLVIVWVYLLVLRWRGRWWEALLAAGVLGAGWELNYHARYVAADALVAMFGALTLGLTLDGWRSASQQRTKRWLTWAAVCAGLATGTKYTAGLLILPILLAAWFGAGDRSLSSSARLSDVLRVVLIFGTTLLVTTPGMVLEPLKFLQDLVWESVHYSTGHWAYWGHTIQRGAPHLWANLRYLGGALLSRWWPVSLVVAALGVVGTVDLVRRERRAALLTLIVPVLYVAYLSVQSVFFVRNLLLVAPFLAILIARGASTVADWLPDRTRAAVPALLGLVLSANAGWMLFAATTIPDRDVARYWGDFSAYAARRPDRMYWASPGVLAEGTARLPNVTADPTDADFAVFLASETIGPAYYSYLTGDDSSLQLSDVDFDDWLSADSPSLTERVFGPYEVNFSYYPDWVWQERIVVMEMDKAREQRLRPLRLDR